MSTSLVSELEKLANALETDGTNAAELPLPAVAEKIAKNLGVKTDEVAILGVLNRWRHLHFIVPLALKKVGFIPLTSNSALGHERHARAARKSTTISMVRGTRAFLKA